MFVTIIQIIFGSVFVLFLPGFVWSYVFFSKKELDNIERIALSFGLSIAMVPLAVFFSNRIFGIKINFINSFIIILLLIILPVFYLLKNNKFSLSKIKKYLNRTNSIFKLRGRVIDS